MRARSQAVLLTGLVLVAAGGLATAFLVRARPTRAVDRVEAHLGTATLVYPPAYARFGPGRSGGILDRVEMAFTFPDGRAAGRAASALPSDEDDHPDANGIVFLSLRPAEEGADPSERTAVLYARFLQSDIWREEGGLVMRRFEAGSPYENEELHFLPPEGRVFAARCMRPTQPPSDLPSTCLAALRVEGLDVDIRFPPRLLPRWEALTDGVRRLVGSFVVR